jgi:hypothetical protein
VEFASRSGSCLLVAVLGILSGCRSSRDLEAFARRHRETLNQALGLDFKRWPSDTTFLYLFNKAHLQEYAQMTVYARALGVALAQTTYDTGESSERAALKELLSSLELEGVLIQRENGRSLSRQNDQQGKHGRNTTWELKAREAPEHIKAN